MGSPLASSLGVVASTAGGGGLETTPFSDCTILGGGGSGTLTAAAVAARAAAVGVLPLVIFDGADAAAAE